MPELTTYENPAIKAIEVSNGERRRAILKVCAEANDRNDARFLLEALGLDGHLNLMRGVSRSDF